MVEILAILIRSNPSIKGVMFHKTKITITQFADDTTCFLRSADALEPLMETLRTFASWSGLLVNRNKTKIISPALTACGVSTILDMPVVQKTKILGIWVGLENTESNAYHWNYKDPLDKIKAICESWVHRNLSIKGKITVANALLISILQYQASVTVTPERVFGEYRKIISDFIWDGKKPKIVYSSLTQPIERGGLKLMDLRTRVEVNFLQWAKRMLNKPDMNAASALRHIAGADDVVKFLTYRNPPFNLDRGRFKFYAQLMAVWKKHRNFEPSTETAVRGEPLWFNNRIGPRNSFIFWPTWQRKGIETVGDISHDSDDRLLSHTELSEKFDITCTFLEALSLRSNIPLPWRNILSKNWRPDPPNWGLELNLDGNQPATISSLSAKEMYSNLLARNQQTNTALKRWKEGDDGLEIADDTEWAAICSRAFQTRKRHPQGMLQEQDHKCYRDVHPLLYLQAKVVPQWTTGHPTMADRIPRETQGGGMDFQEEWIKQKI